MNYSSDAEELIGHIVSGSFTSDQLLEILRLHTHGSEGCGVCEEVDENGPMTCLFELIFDSNKGLMTREILDYMIGNFSSTSGNDYLNATLCSEWAAHPSSSQETLAGGGWGWGASMFDDKVEGLGYSIEEAEHTLKAVADHPLATEEIFREWMAFLHEPRPMHTEPILTECQGAIETCATCQGIIDRVWSRRSR